MLARELKKLLEKAGYGGTGGQKRFRLYMAEQHGMEVSAEAVSSWLRGARQPTLTHLLAILDAFAVFGEERDRLLRLASGRQAPDSGNRPEPEGLGPDDTPTELDIRARATQP